MTERHEMEAVIEAILFVAHDPISRQKLIEVFGEREREAAAEAIEAVVERYRESPERGVVIDEVAGGLRLVTRPDLHGYLKRFFEVQSANKLSMPALETLAIIAYRQPVTAPEVQELRGVNSSGVVKTLLERRLIRIAGRKEVVGKPFLYATTREFLMHFGLKSLKELPPLEQFEELLGEELLEASPAETAPDPEEQVDREAADLRDAADEERRQAEIEEVDQERLLGEEQAEIEAVAMAAESAAREDEEPTVEETPETPAGEEPAAQTEESTAQAEESPAEAEEPTAPDESVSREESAVEVEA